MVSEADISSSNEASESFLERLSWIEETMRCIARRQPVVIGIPGGVDLETFSRDSSPPH